jgi:hypothetical protein
MCTSLRRLAAVSVLAASFSVFLSFTSASAEAASGERSPLAGDTRVQALSTGVTNSLSLLSGTEALLPTDVSFPSGSAGLTAFVDVGAPLDLVASETCLTVEDSGPDFIVGAYNNVVDLYAHEDGWIAAYVPAGLAAAFAVTTHVPITTSTNLTLAVACVGTANGVGLGQADLGFHHYEFPDATAITTLTVAEPDDGTVLVTVPNGVFYEWSAGNTNLFFNNSPRTNGVRYTDMSTGVEHTFSNINIDEGYVLFIHSGSDPWTISGALSHELPLEPAEPSATPSILYVGIIGGDIADVLSIPTDEFGPSPALCTGGVRIAVIPNIECSLSGDSPYRVQGVTWIGAQLKLALGDDLVAVFFSSGQAQAVADYVRAAVGESDTVVLVAGHSAGGGDVQDVVSKLAGVSPVVDVRMAVFLDSIELLPEGSIPPNVSEVWNYHQGTVPVQDWGPCEIPWGEESFGAVDETKTAITNVLIPEPVTHCSIDNDLAPTILEQFLGLPEGVWVDSVAPNQASVLTSSPTTLTASYQDWRGWEHLRHAELRITAGGGAPECRVRYNHDRDTFQLFDSSWSDVGGVPASTTYCELDPSQSAYVGSGNELEVSFHLAFTEAFAGRHGLRLKAQNDVLATTDASIAKKGYIIVRGPPQAPMAVSVSPADATVDVGTRTIFIASYSDPNGWKNLRYGELKISSGPDWPFCRLRYDQNANRFWLRYQSSPNQGVWIDAGVPGHGVVTSREGCTFDPEASSVSNDGDTMTVRFALTFPSELAGRHGLRLKAKDDSGTATPTQKMGFVVVEDVALEPSPMATIYGAVRVGDLSADKTHYRIGESIRVSWQLENVGSDVLVIPPTVLGGSYEGLYVVGIHQRLILRLGETTSAAAGGEIIHTLYTLPGHTWADGASLGFTKTVSTDDLAPGGYRLFVEYRGVDGVTWDSASLDVTVE